MEEELLINNSLIWDYLASSKEVKNLTEISNFVSLDIPEIKVSLSKLCNYGLINREKKNEENFYSIVYTLDAFSWAKAVELGVEIAQLEKHVKLSSEEDSLEITLNGRFEEEENKKKEEQVKKRNKYFYGKAATEAAKSDLSKLVKSKENAIEEYRKSKNYDKEVEFFLVLALESIQVAYDNLINSYFKTK